jgi:DNA (cytosine-5)-methyltransferase 1
MLRPRLSGSGSTEADPKAGDGSSIIRRVAWPGDSTKSYRPHKVLTMSGRPRLPLRAIDLFCGAGGLSEGFRATGYEIPFALDHDEDSCATYRLNHPTTHVECASITDFTPGQIAKMTGGRVHVVLGGPSCQSFSTAGRRTRWVAEGDARNDLWEHMFEVVALLKPCAFVMENVPGMVYFRSGEFGDAILKRFASIGYTVNKEILLAADWGVPQRRRRLFIVGVLSDQPFVFPEPTHMGGWRRDTLHLWEERRKQLGLREHLTVWDAIGDLPDLGGSVGPKKTYRLPADRAVSIARVLRRGSRTLRDHEIQPVASDTLELIRQVPPGGTWRDIPPHLLPDRYRGMRRTDSTNLLGRLDAALPAYTITTQFNNVTTGCFTHPYEDRSLSVREGARLQTFPDTYHFVGSLTSRCRQIGNAVPPLLASVLAHAIAVQIAGPRAVDVHPAPTPPARGPAQQAPPPMDDLTRARMRRQARQDTAAERAVQTAVAARGISFAVGTRPDPAFRRTGDLVIEEQKIVVMVNGCFWHGCPKHSRPTKSHTKWWSDKIKRNQERDVETVQHWQDLGWEVIVFWEHEDPEDVARHVEEVLAARNAASSSTTRHRQPR